MRSTCALTLAAAALIATGCEDPNDTRTTTTTRTPAPTTPTTTDRPTTPTTPTTPRDTMDRSTTPGSPTTPATPPNAAGATITETERTFVAEAASGNMFEIQSSQLIVQSTADQEIKDLAQMIVDDHTKAQNELKSIAQKKNITVPSTMQGAQQSLMDQLRNLSGEQLADRYLEVQAKAHRDTISRFEQAVNNLKDSELKTFAQQTLPTLRKHLDEVQQHTPAATGAGGTETPE